MMSELLVKTPVEVLQVACDEGLVFCSFCCLNAGFELHVKREVIASFV